MRTKNLNKRIAALEKMVRTQPSFGTRVIEQADLPASAKAILLRAIRNTVAAISYEERDQLNAALDALPAAERARVEQAMEAKIILAMCDADLSL